MSDAIDAVIIGAGQAGLSTSHELTRLGVEHVVLERGAIAQSWRDRWDSFCLVTPNWTVLLPGGEYQGPDPDGYLPRDEIVAHMRDYAGNFGAPVREGIEVRRLARDESGFVLETDDGPIGARMVVVASGAYQKPHRPAGARALPPSVFTIDADGYTNPSALPPGAVLVVGSGQTGCQLAEELFESGRETVLACGRAPWMPRRIEGEDMVRWVLRTPFMERTLDEVPPGERLVSNVLATGHGGGHDLHYRTLQAMGVRLAGHLAGVDSGRAHFSSDLAESVTFGDARYVLMRDLIHAYCDSAGQARVDMPDPPPFVAEPLESIEMGGLGAVIFTSGFRPDYTSWIHVESAFDDLGFPLHRDCESTAARGLFFVGVHFLRKRKSSLLLGVREDATSVAQAIASRSG